MSVCSHTLSLAETPHRKVCERVSVCGFSVTEMIREEGFNKRPTGGRSAGLRETVSSLIKR